MFALIQVPGDATKMGEGPKERSFVSIFFRKQHILDSFWRVPGYVYFRIKVSEKSKSKEN